MPRLKVLNSADSILKAETVIDEIIEVFLADRGTSQLLVAEVLQGRIERFFQARGCHDWYKRNFSTRGWQVLIEGRLQAAGLKKFMGGWGYR